MAFHNDPFLVHYFTLYINDFSNAINCNSKLYAHDTCLIIKKKNFDSFRLSINEELVKVNRWMNANQLTINPKKLTILLLQPTLKNIPLNFEIRFKNHNISSCEYVNYLGINLDQYLNFKPHISILAKKTAKSVGILWKLRKFLPKKTFISLYHAFVQSHLLYGIVTWGPSVSSNTLNQL